MINEPALAQWPWSERVVTLAHELVHASQLELAGHRSLDELFVLIVDLSIEAVMACDVLGDEAVLPELGAGSLSVVEAVGDITDELGADASAAVFCEALRVRLFAN